MSFILKTYVPYAFKLKKSYCPTGVHLHGHEIVAPKITKVHVGYAVTVDYLFPAALVCLNFILIYCRHPFVCLTILACLIKRTKNHNR